MRISSDNVPIRPAGWAAVTVLTADLNGANELPANMSPGTGTATVTLDTSAIDRTLRV